MPHPRSTSRRAALPFVRLRRAALGAVVSAILAIGLLPATAAVAAPATPLPSAAAPAADIPTPEEGDYVGSNTEDEADPGEYAAQDDAAHAVSLSGFDAGNLISDAAMYTSGTMTAAQIQSFITGKAPKCDRGYTCLKDFAQRTATKKADAYCTQTYQGASRESAGTIISKVSRACGVSEKVLLVMLQKEQGLVTHHWPSDWRYDIAMGYACPDGAACDERYFGFQNQVYMAAHQLQRYSKDSFFNWYPVGKTSQVRWHPDASCGSGPVRIQNKATAALYYYTPYQPNRASLAAGYAASNDRCASYGNRNFYNYYTDWFGPSRGGGGPKADSSGTVAVHRFWSSKFDNAHFYTANAAEADALRRTDPNWTYEGTDFRVWPASNGGCRAGTVAVHRFWSSTFASHFYTTNGAEAAKVRSGDKNWSYEGVGFCTAASGQAGTVPVHRFWSAKFEKHFYTANAAEARKLRETDRNWTYEGVAMYAPR
ncbi:hypothetical protein GCM10022219_00960 [Microbacterium oryzae]|uniref:DUF5648 domain-containing protein n=1 Tax=Microbacterium oryzae TaxID=743009 RepID=A0A6I6E6I3_9MICO|nr:hypothetical protein [Microbacterium oryzae]QGU27281.1 hypothetical protein D7D94_06095 [Microbacterium oryzae]